MMIDIFSILAGMWSLGCIACVFCMAWAFLSDSYDRNITAGALIILVGLPLGALLAILPWALAAQSRSPDLAVLKKGQWACTATHSETHMQLVGKVMVPQTRRVCDAYGRTR